MTWQDFALAFGYISKEEHENLYREYEHISNMLGQMMNAPEKFALKKIIGISAAMLVAATVIYTLLH